MKKIVNVLLTFVTICICISSVKYMIDESYKNIATLLKTSIRLMPNDMVYAIAAIITAAIIAILFTIVYTIIELIWIKYKNTKGDDNE